MATDYEWWLSRVWQGPDNRCALAEGLLPPTYKPSQPPINSCRLPWLWLSAPSLDLPGRASKYRGVEVPGHPLCMRQLSDTALSLQDGNHTGLDVESGEEAKVVSRDTGWREGRKLQFFHFLDIPLSPEWDAPWPRKRRRNERVSTTRVITEYIGRSTPVQSPR